MFFDFVKFSKIFQISVSLFVSVSVRMDFYEVYYNAAAAAVIYAAVSKPLKVYVAPVTSVDPRPIGSDRFNNVQ